MAEFTALFLQKRGKRFQTFAAVNNAGGIVRGIDDDRLGMRRQRFCRRFRVELKIGGVGRYDHALHPRAGGEHRIFREERRVDHDLGPLDAKRGKHGRQRRGGPAGEKEILRPRAAGKAVAQILCDRLARVRRAGGGGVAVDALGVRSSDERGDRIVHAAGRGDGGIADGKIKDILPPDLGGFFHAVFKKIPDARAVCAELPLFFVYHVRSSLGGICPA